MNKKFIAGLLSVSVAASLMTVPQSQADIIVTQTSETLPDGSTQYTRNLSNDSQYQQLLQDWANKLNQGSRTKTFELMEDVVRRDYRYARYQKRITSPRGYSEQEIRNAEVTLAYFLRDQYGFTYNEAMLIVKNYSSGTLAQQALANAQPAYNLPQDLSESGLREYYAKADEIREQLENPVSYVLPDPSTAMRDFLEGINEYTQDAGAALYDNMGPEALKRALAEFTPVPSTTTSQRPVNSTSTTSTARSSQQSSPVSNWPVPSTSITSEPSEPTPGTGGSGTSWNTGGPTTTSTGSGTGTGTGGTGDNTGGTSGTGGNAGGSGTTTTSTTAVTTTVTAVVEKPTTATSTVERTVTATPTAPGGSVTQPRETTVTSVSYVTVQPDPSDPYSLPNISTVVRTEVKTSATTVSSVVSTTVTADPTVAPAPTTTTDVKTSGSSNGSVWLIILAVVAGLGGLLAYIGTFLMNGRWVQVGRG